MSRLTGLTRHLSVGVLAFTTLAAAPAARQAPDITGSATFLVLVSGTRVGAETTEITRSESGWRISSTGELQAPFDLITHRFEVTYGPDWQPRRLTLDGVLRGQPLLVSASFNGTTATSEMTRGTQHGSATHQVAPNAIAVSSNVFSAYEVLALRLASASAGTKLPLYIAPSGPVEATVGRIVPRRIFVGTRAIDIREYNVTIAAPTGAVPVDLWVDARGRLARLVLPAASVVVIRDDLSSVIAHEEPAHNPGDEEVSIGANGFSLAATITHPSNPTAPAPAVVLVAGPGPQDRDYFAFGVPIFGQLAGALARAGVLAVRYDVRGGGRSGGRQESARIGEYAEDVLAVVKWLRKRKDVDDRRVVVAGYGDAAPIALLAASRDDDVAGVILIGAYGRNGRDVTIDRQKRVLAPLPLTEAEKTARIGLQVQVMDAVVSGKGWEALPDELRDQADTPWFKSWLQFDPADAIRKIDRPILIVHGARDTDVPAGEADRIERLAASRPKIGAAATRKAIVPGVDHLLLPAATSGADELAMSGARAMSPDVTRPMIEWIETLR
jgi:pimeloyl-ACP methyl ester carboxylesterase